MAGLTPPRPLTALDNRESFDCGRESMNQWFRRHAWRNQADGTTRTTIFSDTITGLIAGYVSLSAAQIARDHLARPARRNCAITSAWSGSESSMCSRRTACGGPLMGASIAQRARRDRAQ